jgi:hydroxyacyl-ACP dehydratase HTD2-like protein with hotdog domain
MVAGIGVRGKFGSRVYTKVEPRYSCFKELELLFKNMELHICAIEQETGWSRIQTTITYKLVYLLA